MKITIKIYEYKNANIRIKEEKPLHRTGNVHIFWRSCFCVFLSSIHYICSQITCHVTGKVAREVEEIGP